MSGLLWPGLHRSGPVFDDGAVLAAMVRVELCWMQTLEAQGFAAPGSSAALALVADELVAEVPEVLTPLAVEAEGGGNPLIPVLTQVRARLRRLEADAGDGADAATEATAALHRGLTSQDVLDTALMVCAKECLTQVEAELDLQVVALAELAQAHHETLMVARTLGQYALPTTFGTRVRGWQRGILEARERVRAEVTTTSVQLGGAVGTRAAVVEMCRAAGHPSPMDGAETLVVDLARRLDLAPSPAWHTVRTRVTAVGDALTTVSDALGHVANDVLLASRSEIGELSEPTGEGRGVSSAMPQKQNPVLSVLIRRHALSAPLLSAQLHLAAAGAAEERPGGAWHTEWQPCRDLCVRTLAAARQATELMSGLQVHTDAMRRHLDDALPGALAERLVPALAPVTPGGAAAVRHLIASSADAETFVAAVRAVVGEAVSQAELRELLDPRGYLGTAVMLAETTPSSTDLPVSR